MSFQKYKGLQFEALAPWHFW